MSDRLYEVMAAVWRRYIGLPDGESEDGGRDFLYREHRRLTELSEEAAGTLWEASAARWMRTHDRAYAGHDAVSFAQSALREAVERVIKDEVIGRIPHRMIHDMRHRWTHFEADVSEPVDLANVDTGRSGTRKWRELADEVGVEVEYICSEGDYDGFDPIEDRALPPAVEWTDADKKRALDRYIESRGLGRGEWVDMEWPPEPSLWREGHWYWSEVEPCPVHQEECAEDECVDCEDSREPVIDQMAEWHWTTTVHVYELAFGDDGSEYEREDTEHGYEIATVEQDPRDVLLGPPRRWAF